MSWRLSQSSNNSGGTRQSVSFTNQNLTSIPEFWAKNPKVEKVNFSNNPKIKLIDKIPILKYLRVLNLDNTSLASLKGANELPNLEEITFLGTPFANNTFSNLMCLSIYPNLKRVNNVEFSKREIAFVEKNKSTISRYVYEGYILMSIGNYSRKSDLENSISIQEGETSLKFINPETRKRKTFYENTRLSFLGQESIDSIPPSINNPEYKNLEVLILSGTRITDLFGLPTLPKLRDLQLDNSKFTSFNNCLSEQPRLESISYSNTPFNEFITYNKEMTLIVFPTLKIINKKRISDEVIQNVNNILSKDKLSKDKIIKRDLVISDIKSGPKFLHFDHISKRIYDSDEIVNSDANKSRKNKNTLQSDLSDDDNFAPRNPNKKNKSKAFFMSSDSNSQSDDIEERPKAQSQVSPSKKRNKKPMKNKNKNELLSNSDDEEINTNPKRPKAQSLAPKSKNEKLRSTKKNVLNNSSDDEEINRNEYSEELEEMEQNSNSKRPKAGSQVPKPKTQKNKTQPILRNKPSNNKNHQEEILFNDEDDEEINNQKRPKAQSQVANSRKENTKQKRANKNISDNDNEFNKILSENEEEEINRSQKRPKAQSLVPKSKKEKLKQTKKNAKSNSSDNEEIHRNEYSEELEEMEQNNNKQPKAGSQVPSSKRKANRNQNHDNDFDYSRSDSENQIETKNQPKKRQINPKKLTQKEDERQNFDTYSNSENSENDFSIPKEKQKEAPKQNSESESEPEIKKAEPIDQKDYENFDSMSSDENNKINIVNRKRQKIDSTKPNKNKNNDVRISYDVSSNEETTDIYSTPINDEKNTSRQKVKNHPSVPKFVSSDEPDEDYGSA